jgi:hypothetical protein
MYIGKRGTWDRYSRGDLCYDLFDHRFLELVPIGEHQREGTLVKDGPTILRRGQHASRTEYIRERISLVDGMSVDDALRTSVPKFIGGSTQQVQYTRKDLRYDLNQGFLLAEGRLSRDASDTETRRVAMSEGAGDTQNDSGIYKSVWTCLGFRPGRLQLSSTKQRVESGSIEHRRASRS